ncbi:hypothetical protein PFISCL1PPCAC_24285, partial [Pristionchus fissidentatus]
LLLLFSPLIVSIRLSTPPKIHTVDTLLREARCESYCFTQVILFCFIIFHNLLCQPCKSTCPEAREKAPRKRIEVFLTPSLRVKDRRKGEIELDVNLSTTCEQCLIVLEYRFMSGVSNTVSTWTPFQIVTPGVYSYSGLQLDSAYQFRTSLIYLWQKRKVAVTQWADLSPD